MTSQNKNDISQPRFQLGAVMRLNYSQQHQADPQSSDQMQIWWLEIQWPPRSTHGMTVGIKAVQRKDAKERSLGSQIVGHHRSACLPPLDPQRENHVYLVKTLEFQVLRFSLELTLNCIFVEHTTLEPIFLSLNISYQLCSLYLDLVLFFFSLPFYFPTYFCHFFP